jgi:transposase
MNQKYFIGIDISKSKLDIAVLSSDREIVSECVISNNVGKVRSFFKTFIKRHKIELDELLICCESTGIYNCPLQRVCSELSLGLWEEHAMRIKRASTDMRGKSDRKDAMRIAEYAMRYKDKAILYKMPSENLHLLDNLSKVRETLIAQKVAMKNQLGEAKSHNPTLYKSLIKHYRPLIAVIESQLKKVDLEIQAILDQSEDLQKNMDLLQSIPGVGKQTALQFIVYTQNFKRFESAKHLACYAGVVPFLNESGTIVKRARISKMASLKLKSLLHLAAMSAIRTKSELKAYYIRKVSEGKNKMTVLNAVRNKILHRIWAVIQSQTPFQTQENFRPI